MPSDTNSLIQFLTFIGGGAAGAGGWVVAWFLWKAKRSDDKETILALKNVALAQAASAEALHDLRDRFDRALETAAKSKRRG